MKKFVLLFLPCLILIGAGCSSSTDSNNDLYDDFNYDSSYDSYNVDTSSIPQGSSTVLGCNLDEEYCASLDVYVEGDEVSVVFDNDKFEYVSVDYSICDELGCAFDDWYGDQWYFEF